MEIIKIIAGIVILAPFMYLSYMNSSKGKKVSIEGTDTTHIKLDFLDCDKK